MGLDWPASQTDGQCKVHLSLLHKIAQMDNLRRIQLPHSIGCDVLNAIQCCKAFLGLWPLSSTLSAKVTQLTQAYYSQRVQGVFLTSKKNAG
jgi:hypothetical protein